MRQSTVLLVLAVFFLCFVVAGATRLSSPLEVDQKALFYFYFLCGRLSCSHDKR